MFRSPHELAAEVRFRRERLASERALCSPIGRSIMRSPSLLSQIRSRLGVGLMRVGAAIAGAEARRGFPSSPAWPELANR